MTALRLSIITITFNNPNLSRTLDSISSQIIPHNQIEHIIVDNLSTDGSKEILDTYIRKAPYKVVYIREKDRGRYDAMNKGIKVATGEYLSFMNAGDHFYDANSARNILDSSKNKDIIYGNLNVINMGKESIYHPPTLVDFKFFLSSALPHQASIIKKSLFEKIGYYDDTLKIASDVKFFLLAICKFKCLYSYVNKTIATYYFDGISSLPSSVKLNEAEKNIFLNKEFSREENKIILPKRQVNTEGFKTPILFLIFNRPDLTQKVFDQIKKIKPKFLFVAADGPRDNIKWEKEKCQKTRNILEQVDWDCDIKTLFREPNFGCGHGVSKAISWFFDQVEEGIILEDDCLPDLSFFSYCEDLLLKYRHDTRVSHINGTSFVCKENTRDSYYFSKYYHVWGWATWRRAWDWYDFSMSGFGEFYASDQIKNIFSNKIIQNFWMRCFNEIYIEKKDTWDYQLVFANFVNNGLSIMPHTNLVKNIGFGDDATHTFNSNDTNANREAGKIKEIKHPQFVIHNVALDDVIYSKHICLPIDPQVNEIYQVRVTSKPVIIWRSLTRYTYFFKKIVSKYLSKIIRGRLRLYIKKIYYALKLNKLI